MFFGFEGFRASRDFCMLLGRTKQANFEEAGGLVIGAVWGHCALPQSTEDKSWA